MTSAPVLALYDPNRDQNCSRCILIWPQSSLLENSIFHVQIDDPHRVKIFTNREGSLGSYMGMWMLKQLHHWEIDNNRNRTHTIDKLPPKIQWYKMKFMSFNIMDVHHVSGKLLYTADTLSRKIAQRCIPLPTTDENEMNAHVASIMEVMPADQEILLGQTGEQTSSQQHDKPYWSICGELTIIQNILQKGKQLVILTSLQSQTLNRIH